ncbi:insulinase family protein [Cellulosilyticum sp. I15G10I2]|uniref:insulinase family protein n=1 Tax=Cellulosilyticum sp. I15G10I2 TaxID=1892843 RepID=UPI00085C3F48|nr:insulinase family protein [Cellulosilyticum sp. I15G10I2]
MLKRRIVIGVLSLCCVIKCYGSEHDFRKIDTVRYGKDTLHTYEHVRSGLGVVWIANKDTKKSFTLGVKTPTTDSTGVNHIIEHTVFTGSKNYPSSRLFFDASAAYPHIFMNALTSGDMTIYPFTTPYMSCYNNLLKVYLDSILKPSMLYQSNGFYEEGYNYNPQTQSFGGVVYNEMKGAYNSVDRAIYRSIRETVYKGTHYAHDSGGDPNEIPKLTYEEFVAAYKKYYYPANMKIILYGDLPIDEILGTIASYLEGDTQTESAVSLMTAITQKEKYQKYFVMPEAEKPCLIKSFVIPQKLTAVQLQLLDLWMNAYLLNPHSDFQKRLQAAGFTNVKIFKDEDLPYPIYSIIVQDIPYLKLNVYNDILEKMIQNLQQETAVNLSVEEDAINQARLAVLSEDQSANRGVEIAQSLLDGWAHERELYQYFIKKEQLKKINSLPKNYGKLLFENAYSYTIELVPGKHKIVSPLTLSKVAAKEWENIIEEMALWQQSHKQSLLEPVSLEEFIMAPYRDTKAKANGDKVYLSTKVPKGLARSHLYYNTSHIKQDQLPYLFLYAYLLNESAKELVPFRGVLEAKTVAFNNEEGYSPYLRIMVFSGEDASDHGGLFTEARQNLLNKDAAWYQHKLIKFAADFKEGWSGNVLSALSSLDMGYERGSKRYLYEQGYPLYDFCDGLIKSGQIDWTEKIKAMDASIYNQRGLIVATASPKVFINPYENSWKKVINSHLSLEIKEPHYHFETYPQKSVLVNDTQVDYIYLQYTQPSGKLDGIDYLTAVYLTKHYLNPQIRIKLGAYGAGCQLSFTDTISLFTYRDPDYEVSMHILKAVPDYLIQGIESSLIETSKIEALARVHNQFKLLGTPIEQADANERNILMGISKKYITELQQQIVEGNKYDLQQKAPLFKIILEKGALGIATNREKKIITGHKIYHFK